VNIAALVDSIPRKNAFRAELPRLISSDSPFEAVACIPAPCASRRSMGERCSVQSRDTRHLEIEAFDIGSRQ
jgi:hypothetical protein